MKKRVGKVKRFIAMLMVGIILSSSVFYSYSIPAQATTVIPAAQTVIEALMTLFGYSLGLGKSTDGMSTTLTPEVFSSAIDSSFNGGGIELGSYGTVDFSDETAVFEFLKSAYQLTTATMASEAYNKLLSSYDYVTYKTSGVSSTKTMNDYLGDIVTKYETDGTSALKEDMQQTFTVVSGGAGSGDDEDPDFTPLSWRIAAAIMAGFAAFGAIPVLDDGSENETVLATPEESEYVEYIQDDLVLGDDGFIDWIMMGENYTGSYSFMRDGELYTYSFYSPSPFFARKVDDFFYLCFYSDYTQYVYIDGSLEYTNHSTVSDYSEFWVDFRYTDVFQSLSVPLFDSADSGKAWISDSFSTKGFLNLISTETVSVFYETTPTCTVPEYVINFMTRTPSTADVTILAAALTELSTETAGTAEYIPAVESVVQTATDALPEASTDTEEVPEESVEQEQDPETGQFNYFNILQLILNAIKAIASQVWDFFSNPITSIKNGIQNIIEIFPQQIDLVRGWIEALPGLIYQFFENPILALQEGLAAINPLETIWPRLQPYLDQFLALFQSSVPEPDITDPDIPSEDDGGNGRHSFDLLSLLNGLWLLIMILIMLLSIFLHLMIFIINIFKIPATTGYLNDDMVLGLNYIKTLEITGIGLSVYDFMMGLVYILMVFGVVKVLRANINHIKIPKSMRGGFFT